MICPRCKHEMNNDALFCPKCGLKLEKCPACQQPIIPGSKFCSHCGEELNPYYKESQLGGYYQPLQETSQQETLSHEQRKQSFQGIEISKKVNKKVISIAIVILIALTALGYGYLEYGPAFTFDNITQKEDSAIITEPIKIGSSTSFASYTGNINQNGETYFDGQNLYAIDEKGSIVKMDADLGNKVTLKNTKSQYLTVVDKMIYYTDDNNHLCSMTTEGKDQKVILNKKVFYPIIKDNKVYYQLDEDKESIHIYDLKTNKDKKINDRVSYNINVVEDKIYYSSHDGIYAIGIDGKGEEKLVADNKKDISHIIYQDKKIYYFSQNQILAYHTETKEIETIVEKDVSALFNINDQFVFYYSATGSLRSYDLKSKQEKDIYSAAVNFVYVAGDKLIVQASQGYKTGSYKVIMDLNGEKQQRLFAGNDGAYV